MDSLNSDNKKESSVRLCAWCGKGIDEHILSTLYIIDLRFRWSPLCYDCFKKYIYFGGAALLMVIIVVAVLAKFQVIR
jgi:hypothetical protein